MSAGEVRARLTGPGGPFEIVEETVLGERMRVVGVVGGRVRARPEIVDVVAQRPELLLERRLEREAGVVGGDENLLRSGGHDCWPH